MSYLNNAVKKAATKKQAVACTAVAAALALSCVAAPAFAQEPAATTTGPAANNQATTDVYLTMNADAQLSVTAPTAIDYVLNTDGSFTCPTDVAITNNSVVPVAVKSYTVADQTAGKAHAVAAAAFDASKESNAWVNNVVAKAGDKATASDSTALNLDQGTLPAAWNMGTKDNLYKETQDKTLALTLDGKMRNLDGQIDFNTKTDLAKVTFTFGSVMNA